MSLLTADICDDHADIVTVAEPIFRDYGGRARFSGPISTLKVHEDNTLVREALAEAGEGRVLVIDGGGSMRCALVGDNLAKLGVDNGWAGIVVYGCIRDSAVFATMDIGCKAMATNPTKSIKRNTGQRDDVVRFAGATFRPGEWLYADEDGVLVSPKAL